MTGSRDPNALREYFQLYAQSDLCNTEAIQVLEGAGITTMQQLAGMSDREITILPGMSALLFAEIYHVMLRYRMNMDESKSTEEMQRYFYEKLPTGGPNVARAVNALVRAKVTSLEQLAAMTDAQIAKVRNLGELSLAEIHKVLEIYRREQTDGEKRTKEAAI